MLISPMEPSVFTCAVEADKTVASTRVELQGGVGEKLLAVEGQGQACYLHISAVGVGRQDPSHSPCLRLLQFKRSQLLGHGIQLYSSKVYKDMPQNKW